MLVTSPENVWMQEGKIQTETGKKYRIMRSLFLFINMH